MIAGQDEPDDKSTFFTLGVPFTVGPHPFMAVTVQDAERLLDDREGLSLLLAREEQAQLARFEVRKRRCEWLAGRLALKVLARDELLLRGLPAEPLDRVVVVSEGHAPRLVLADRGDDGSRSPYAALHASLSHGGGVATAVVGDHPLGIDVEAWRSLSDEARNQAFSATESTLVPPAAAIALWTAKEAVAKAMGAGFGIGDLRRIALLDFAYNEPYLAQVRPASGPEQAFAVMTFKDADLVASIAWLHR